MDTNNEILDAIEILADKKIGENITKVLTGICTAVNIYKDTCTMNCNGVSGTVYFYGSPPEINGLYRIFVPSNDMSRAFVIVPPRFTVNPNLFDNWDYSINQQNATTITTSTAYYADRWRKYGAGTTGTVQKGEVHLVNTGTATCGWQQRFEASRLIGGATYTFSALVKPMMNRNIIMSYGTALDSNTASDFTFYNSNATLGVWSLMKWTFVLPTSTTYYNFRIRSQNVQNDFYIGPVKLELGSQQTLAHKESGSWVLNEADIRSNQLARCQDYFIRLGYPDAYSAVGMGQARTTSDIVYNIPIPVTMRVTPSISLTGAIIFRNGANYYASNHISIEANGPGSLLAASAVTTPTAGLPYDIFLEAGNYITLNANL